MDICVVVLDEHVDPPYVLVTRSLLLQRTVRALRRGHCPVVADQKRGLPLLLAVPSFQIDRSNDLF